MHAKDIAVKFVTSMDDVSVLRVGDESIFLCVQLSCVAVIDGLTSRQSKDVWICSSDHVVSHVCILSLQPEPIITMNTPLPGCSSRITCICNVPAIQKDLSR